MSYYQEEKLFSEYETGKINFLLWFGRVISWDGVLPVVVTIVSTSIAWLFPGDGVIQALAAVFLPILAFFFRFRVGSRQIAENYCAPWLRGIQFISLSIAMLLFLMVDCLIVLVAFMPKNGRMLTMSDLEIFGIMIGIYLLLVTVAMYPGREPSEKDFNTSF